MGSPFPGMDPFLEDPAFWPDFHSTFVHAWREAIADGLPDDYEARIDERVYQVETDPEVRKVIKPDIDVSHGGPVSESRTVGAVATLEPVTMPLEIIDDVREVFIEILHRPERSLAAALELLSPANKEDPGRTEYLSKRNALFRQNVHLIELDFLIGGRRAPSPRPLPKADYYYLLARAEERFDCRVYHWNLADPLPRLPVPLRPPHADVIVDLAQVFATAYERGRFGRTLRYDKPCPAPLSEEQKTWIQQTVSKSARAPQ